jgi:hypothetical protein
MSKAGFIVDAFGGEPLALSCPRRGAEMALSILEDKDRPPASSDVARALGKSARLWTRLVDHIGERYPPITPLWHHGGVKFGWSLRLKRGERILLYLTPQRGYFMVGVVLGDQAVQALEKQTLPATIRAAIAGARRFAEGTGVRLTVTTTEDLRAVEDIAAAKMAPR